VERIEGETVVLQDEQERVFTLTRGEYSTLTGREPSESDVLTAEIARGRILSAVYDGEGTVARREAARGRLHRLFGGKRG
jgi:hypothetical protein